MDGSPFTIGVTDLNEPATGVDVQVLYEEVLPPLAIVPTGLETTQDNKRKCHANDLRPVVRKKDLSTYMESVSPDQPSHVCSLTLSFTVY